MTAGKGGATAPPSPYRGPIVIVRTTEWDALRRTLLLVPTNDLRDLLARLDTAISRRDTTRVKT